MRFVRTQYAQIISFARRHTNNARHYNSFDHAWHRWRRFNFNQFILWHYARTPADRRDDISRRRAYQINGIFQLLIARDTNKCDVMIQIRGDATLSSMRLHYH